MKFVRETEAEYHSQRPQHLTAHKLADFRKCPRKFHAREVGLTEEQRSPAFALGSAAHKYILEGPSAFEEMYVVGAPINPKTGKSYGRDTKAYAEWFAAQAKPTVSEEEFATIQEMSRAVRNHPIASDIVLAADLVEITVRGELMGVACQSRIDMISLGEIVELKTCEDLDRFANDIIAYGYYSQMAFYRSMVYGVNTMLMPCSIVATEKQFPYRVGCWKLDAQKLQYAINSNNSGIAHYLACKESNRWPDWYQDWRVA